MTGLTAFPAKPRGNESASGSGSRAGCNADIFTLLFKRLLCHLLKWIKTTVAVTAALIVVAAHVIFTIFVAIIVIIIIILVINAITSTA